MAEDNGMRWWRENRAQEPTRAPEEKPTCDVCGCSTWRTKAQEKNRCATILEGMRMLEEAYADPGRQREPKEREGYAIALLWEAEKRIRGYAPSAYMTAAQEAAEPALAAFKRACRELTPEAFEQLCGETRGDR